MSNDCRISLFIHYILMQGNRCYYVRFRDHRAQIMGNDAASMPIREEWVRLSDSLIVLQDCTVSNSISRTGANVMFLLFISILFLKICVDEEVSRGRGWCFRNLAGAWGCIGTTSAICPQTSIFAFSWLFFAEVANCILGARKSDYNADKRHC